MKHQFPLILTIAVLSSFLFQNCCGNSDEFLPEPPSLNFTLNNSEGNLFQTPNNLTLDSIKIFKENLNDLAMYEFREDEASFSVSYFGGESINDSRFKHTFFIIYPANDIDTITFEVAFSKEKCGGSSSQLENIFYNNDSYGEVSSRFESFDFIKI